MISPPATIRKKNGEATQHSVVTENRDDGETEGKAMKK